jgi:MFS superfamily sulfate permease-like transporter
MLAGIGVIIVLKQIPHALGHDQDFEGDIAFVQVTDGKNTFEEIVLAIYTFSPGALLITVLSLAVLLFWDSPFIKKQKWALFVPGPLVVVILGILINELYGFLIPDWQLLGANGHLVALPIADSPSSFAGFFSLPDFNQITRPEIWKIALVLAVVASIESLLCIEAAD